MNCGCTSNQNSVVSKYASKNSSIVIVEEPKSIEELTVSCNKNCSSSIPKSHISLPVNNDAPLAVHLKTVDECAKYPIDARDIENLRVEYMDASVGRAGTLPYSYDALESDLIHMNIEASNGASVGDVWDIVISGDLYGSHIEFVHDKALTFTKALQPEDAYAIMPSEQVLTDALFIPSPRGKKATEDVLKEYTEVLNEMKASYENIKHTEVEMEDELDKLKKMTLEVIPSLVTEIQLLRKEIEEMKKEIGG